MAEQGKITISVGVDSGQAIDGLKDLQDGLKDMGDTSGKAGAKVVDSFEDIDKAAKDSAKAVDKSSSSAQKAMKETAKVAQKSGKETTDAMDQADTIQGLDSLQDKTGELDSSLKGLAGAVGLVSPEMEMLLMRTGDLSGGFEASARLSKLAGGSMKSLMVAGGTLAVAVAALGGTWAIMSRKVAAAEERLAEAHKEMVEGIAFAKQYKDQLQGLQNSVGLLSDEEFALIDARRRSNEFMKEEIEGQRAHQSVLGSLRKDLEELQSAQERLTKLQGSDVLEVNAQTTVSFRDVNEAIRLTNDAIENGKPVLESFGETSTHFTGRQVLQGEALQEVEAQIANVTGSISRYEQSIEKTEKKTERLNLLFQIQAAQARDDRQAVAELAMSLAVLDDTETRLFKATIEAAKAFAIQNAQMANLGAGTAVAIASIERLFSKYEQTAAPQAFQETLARLNTKLEDNATATANATAATKTQIDVQGEIDRQMREQEERQRAARAAVALELSDREAIIEGHRQKKEELQQLLRDELISYEDYAAKLTEIDNKKKEDLLANDIALAQARIATAQAFTAEFDALQDARQERAMQRLEQEEANALAMASHSEEAQAAIRAEFETKRKEELNKAFKQSQATQIATAIMSGANAAIGALAPPPVGLGPNAAGLAMAALVAATTTAQVGVIANQKPSFHQGGMIGGQGDQMITAQGGEAVLNRAAVATLGGESGVDSLNAGGAGGGAVVVQMVYKQRVLDELIVDNLAKGGPLKRAINDSSRRARRGRIGGRL